MAGNQVAQGKSSGIAVTSGTQTAMLGNQPLRIAQTTYMTNTGQLVNGNGQLLSGNQAMLGQLQAMTIQQSNLQPLANQQVTILECSVIRYCLGTAVGNNNMVLLLQ